VLIALRANPHGILSSDDDVGRYRSTVEDAGTLFAHPALQRQWKQEDSSTPLRDMRCVR
jgi:hypothetical protein